MAKKFGSGTCHATGTMTLTVAYDSSLSVFDEYACEGDVYPTFYAGFLSGVTYQWTDTNLTVVSNTNFFMFGL